MNLNQQIYDENWETWHDMKVYGPASRWLRALITDNLRALDRANLKTVLDVGSGEGTTTAMLSRELPHAQVTGIDFSEVGVALAGKEYGNARTRFVHDPDSRLLGTEKFDLVTCFEVLEHVDDWESLLGRICDASKRSVILYFPVGRMRPYEVNVGHVRNFAKGQVEEFMARKGFSPAQLLYAGFPFYSPLYRDVCDKLDAGANSFTRGRYGFRQKAVANVIYTLFRFFSLRRVGDQFCGAFTRVA